MAAPGGAFDTRSEAKMNMELVSLYQDALREDGRDMIQFEIADSKRLVSLHEMRLKCLRERDPALALVREGAVELYDQYEKHFTDKLNNSETRSTLQPSSSTTPESTLLHEHIKCGYWVCLSHK